MLTQSKTIYGGLRALGRELEKEPWHGTRYTILVDENTFQHCLPVLIGSVETLQEADFIEVPVGEECKCLEVAAQVWQTLIEGGADHNTVIVNLGGGTVCDLGGFVAAGYMRGIRHINIPTTLLAMTDAALGGKTAIDFGGVKNSIGHFYPAAITAIDPTFLDTLPQTEMLNGKMEMVKTALVADEALYQELTSSDNITRQQITATARIKNRVVKADPQDRSIRHILNFGHTFGHAIELHSHLPHGIAVGIGMKAALYLSTKKIGLPIEVYNTYSAWLKAQLSNFTFHLSPFTLKDIEQMLPLMRRDKKNADGETLCVLLQAPGAAMIDVPVSDNEVRDTLLKL
jgi:3-dehydroquinate synthase